MRTSLSVVAALTLTLSGSILAGNDWLTGVVIEITTGHTDTGATSNSTGSVNGGPTGVGTISSSTTTTLTGSDYTDYSIRAGDRLFVVRPDPLVPKESFLSKFARYGGWPGFQKQPVPVTIPINVGEQIFIAPFGDRAWARFGKRQYACTVVRQVLLSRPDDKQAQPQSSPAQSPDSSARPDPDADSQRPTLRRER